MVHDHAADFVFGESSGCGAMASGDDYADGWAELVRFADGKETFVWLEERLDGWDEIRRDCEVEAEREADAGLEAPADGVFGGVGDEVSFGAFQFDFDKTSVAEDADDVRSAAGGYG